MPTKIENLASPVPWLPANASIRDAALLFEHDRALDVVALCTQKLEPLGLITRKSCTAALAEKDPCGGTLSALIDDDAPVIARRGGMRSLARLASRSPESLANGVIVTGDGKLFGVIKPEKLVSALGVENRRLARERAAAMRAVRESGEQRLMFLAHVGHELKTPLNAIIGYADLIATETLGPLEPTAYGRYVRAIKDSGDHLLSVINGVLDLAKIDAHGMELAEEALDLNALARSAISMVRTQADERGVKVVLKPRIDLPQVFADEQILRQILLNLLTNAIKFTPEGKRVTISFARVRGGHLRIIVQDQGPGIPADKIETVMQPFKQADRDVARRMMGTGLGLPLVKAFAELHEGRFQLLSAEGRGTRAIVTLPAGRVLDERPGSQQAFAFTRQTLSV